MCRAGRRLAAMASMLVAVMASTVGCTIGDGSTSTSSSGVSLNVGYIDTSINGVGVIAVANELDLWNKVGLNVNLVPFTDGPTQVQAMQSGQIDVGYIGGGATWLPASGRAKIIAPSEVINGDYVLARPDSGISSLPELRGKRIGYPEGGSGQMILALALEQAGLTDSDVQKVVLAPQSVSAAFAGNQIDAAAIFSPIADQIMTSVPGTRVLATNSTFPDVSFLGAWVASNDAVTAKREAVVRFLQAYAEANDFRVAQVERTAQLAAVESGVPESQMVAQAKVSRWTESAQIARNNADGVTLTQFASMQETFIKIGRLPAPVDPATYVNTELFAAAMSAQQR